LFVNGNARKKKGSPIVTEKQQLAYSSSKITQITSRIDDARCFMFRSCSARHEGDVIYAENCAHKRARDDEGDVAGEK
jgi:hypothetical protein